MSQVIRYVDPDASGLGDGTSWEDAYTGLEIWNTTEATDLVSDGDYHTVYCRSSGGTADGTYCFINSWITDVTHYIEIIGSDFPSDGIWDDEVYRMYVLNMACIYVQADFVYVRNMQLYAYESVDSGLRGIAVSNTSASSVIEIDSCSIRCAGMASGNTNVGVYNVGPGTVYLYNSVLIDWGPYRSPAVGGGWSVRQANALGSTYVYNCTVYNTNTCNGGLQNYTGTMVAKNCIVHSNRSGYDFDGTITIENCCSDDGSGTNAQTPLGGDWDNEFTDKDNLDFSILPTGNCAENGTNNPGSGLYLDDIIGNSRT